MHKRLLMLLIIPVLLTMTTACGTTTTEGNTKKITKTIELSDSVLGYTTTFRYDAEEKYSEIEEKQKDSSNTITFENEDLEVEFEVSYEKISVEKYNETENLNATTKNYKQYTFGDYEAYAYGDEEDIICINVLLGIDESTAEVLLVTIKKTNMKNKNNIHEILERQELQDLFNSMEFVKE